MNKIIDWMERGLIPDSGIRLGIRRLIKKRLDDESALQNGSSLESIRKFVDELNDLQVLVENLL